MLKFLSAFFLSLMMLQSPLLADDPFSSAQEEEVRKIIRDTLVNNPEIVMEALQILQQRQQQSQRDQQERMLSSLKERVVNGPLTPIEGNPQGDVTLIEFSDYQCGYCKRVFPSVMEVINQDKNIKFVIKEFAILGPESEIAARAALAASFQDKYMEMHIALMEGRGRLSEEKIMALAEDQGLDMEKLKKDMRDDRVTAEINETRQLAQALGFNGTPAFIINDQIIPGAVPVERLKEAVTTAREKR